MTTKINLLAVSLFLPVFISAQNVIPEPAQYRPAKGEFVLSIAENKALETNRRNFEATFAFRERHYERLCNQ